MAESGRDTQVRGLGEDNLVASCGKGVQRGRGRAAGAFPRKPGQVSSEKSAAGRPQTQVLASSWGAEVLLQRGAGDVGVRAGPAFQALAPHMTTATFKRPRGVVGRERGF